MITIKKMAELLGTSTTTVSNVIHGKTGEVSPAMVEKVQQLLLEYDYVPNINARNLARNKSGIIGLAMKACRDKYENFIKDPFAGELTGAVESCVRAGGYFTMLYISDDITEIISSVASWNVDGLILHGMQAEDGAKITEKIKKPMVFIDCYLEETVPDYVNVGSQDRKGCYDITRYLIGHGHERIAFLADNRFGVDFERLKGFQDALREAGILYTEEHFIMLQPNGDDLSKTLDDVYKKVGDFTAFVCASDYYAAHILNDLKDRGVNIPEDISIVGFDDNVYSQIVRPALTTVHQDVTEKGSLAVDKLFQMIQQEEIGERIIRLPVEIVERASVKKRKGMHV